MKHLKLFLKHLSDNHYSKRSIKYYKWLLENARSFFNKQKIYDESGITESSITGFIEHLNSLYSNERLYYKHISALKKYLTFLENEKQVFLSPMIHTSLPKELKIPRKIIQKDVLYEIFNNLDITTKSGLRTRMILETMYSSALRCMEMINLKITDIDFNEKLLFIRKSKNNKDRIVPVGDEALYWVEKYIKENRGKYLKDKNNNYLIFPISRNNEKFSSEGFYRTITNTLKKQELPVIKPAAIRPTSATQMLLNGMSVLHIQEILGHADLSSTQIYLRLQTKDLIKEITLKHPRNKLDNIKEDLQ